MNNPNLTDQEREIMFGGATEIPFTGELLNEHRDGSFSCKNCGIELFASDTKFDSNSGWPSFAEPVNHQNVILKDDYSYDIHRIEVLCANCGAHLGHVFDDGPEEMGGERYCVNSASLDFTPKEDVKNGD